MISRIQNILINKDFSSRNEKAITYLSKSLYVFLIFKIAFLWPIISDIGANFPPQYGSMIKQVVFLPLLLFDPGYKTFLVLFLIILIVGVAFKPNYFSSACVFWFSLSLSKLISSVANGSDLILNIFLFISIFLATTPSFRTKALFEYQILVSNAALLLGQIQIALIYLLSGYDKLTSFEWRSGAAVHSITQLTFFQNPFLNLEFGELQCVIISWMIILFELGFSILIWFKNFRVPVLLMGVIFHLGIVFFLGLADFGIVMILCYAVFLPVTQTDTLRYEASLKT